MSDVPIHDNDGPERDHAARDTEALEAERGEQEGPVETLQQADSDQGVDQTPEAGERIGVQRSVGEAEPPEGRGGGRRSGDEAGLTPSAEGLEAQALVKEANARKQRYTGLASDRSRHLAFTGIGLIWILSGGGIGNVDEVEISGAYTWPLYLLVLALALDLLQYVVFAFAWDHVASKRRTIYRDGTLSDEDAASQICAIEPKRSLAFGNGLFVAKIVLVAVGYGWLLISAADQLLR